MLILDFDGTITDAEIEGQPFRDGYLDDLAVLTGRTPEEVRAMAARFEAEIAADPDHHGWEYGGHIVAPAAVDPYLRIMPVARRIFDACGAFASPADRARLLDGILYKYNYQKTHTAFRPGARELLLGLANTATYVVTNSHTEPVQRKIRALARDGQLDWLAERVRGRARKYVIDDAFTEVPVALQVPGLSRPVLLRRRRYYEVISELMAQEGCAVEELLVAGDIFELDLALPLAMGARVALVVNGFTPAYEQELVRRHPRGSVVRSLEELASLVGAASGQS